MCTRVNVRDNIWKGKAKMTPPPAMEKVKLATH